MAMAKRQEYKKRNTITPVVVGALGTTPKALKQQLSDIGIETRIVELQKTIILYYAGILQNVLEVWGVLLTQNLKTFNHWFKAYSVSNSNIIIIMQNGLCTMHNGFHLKSNVDRVYISRSGDGRLIGVQDTVETTILGLRIYVRNS